MTQQEAEEPSSSLLTAVFCDTCVLINFAQREWEGDRTTILLEEADVRTVIGEAVEAEFEDVTSRRTDAYDDLLTALLDADVELSEYNPDVWGNDEQHIYELIGQLERLEPEEAASTFRLYRRKFSSRAENLISDVIDEVVFTAPPLFFADTLNDVIPNDDDCEVLAQAIDWANNSESNVLVTMDGEDILQKEAAINEIVADEYEDPIPLVILIPEDALERLDSE
jgi:hypothetical protein